LFQIIIKIIFFLFFFSTVFSHETHEFFLKKDESERGQIFLKIIKNSNLDCDKVQEQFFQGFYNKISIWTIFCANGKKWSVRLPEKLDQELAVKSCDYFGIENYSCMDNLPNKFTNLENNGIVEEEYCRNYPHTVSNNKDFIIDRCGVVKINLENDFEDTTDEYIDLLNKFHATRDPGIVSLLHLSTKRKTHTCKVRLLRYLPTEQGYQYNLKKLTEAIALVYASSETQDYTNDLLKKGLSAPIKIGGQADTFEIVRNNSLKVNSYESWETVIDIWNSKESELISTGHRYYSLVIKYPIELRSSNNKYYIAVECNYFNRKSKLSSGDYWVTELYEDLMILK
jgi:hypothetical protein